MNAADSSGNWGLPSDASDSFFAFMGKASNDSRREERKQRAELERQDKERQKRAQTLRNRAFVVVGLLAVIAVVILGVTRRQSNSGRVWSQEHGHWHDK